MRGPRITSPDADVAWDRFIARWPARYGIGVMLIAVPALLAIALGARVPTEAYVLALFGAILLSSTIAGLGSGLLTTGLSLLVCWLIPGIGIPRTRVHVLGVEGILVSIVGGAFRAARRKAGERLATNLRLEQQIIEIGDDERRRIGHDLHDGLGQHLTGISLLSETMAQQLETGRHPDPANVENITRLVSEAVRITRDLAKSLSPVTLERDGLVAAMEELAETASGLFGINCHWDFDGNDPALERTRALHLFRIVQEAVNNSVRHGKARNVRIGMRTRADQITLTVADDGSGLSTKTMINPGLGLRIMQYRARMLDAALAVERADAAGGTVVICTCPIDAAVKGSDTNALDRNRIAPADR